MKGSTKALIAQEGGRILSDIIRVVGARPSRPASEASAPVSEITETKPAPEVKQVTPTPSPTKTTQEELDYRWECCMKHLGGASILLREAYERVIDEGVGEGTAEKIMEAMNEHSGMEADLEKMLPIPEARAEAEKLMSGVRSFRSAAWKAKLPTGGGTKEDIQDACMWNDILYQEAFTSAKQQPGEACIVEGM
ncbi:hypothetical protein ES703_101160 [subsurface metagenome]